jgi:hypothetical protein
MHSSRLIPVEELAGGQSPPPLLKPAEVAGVLNVTVSQVYTLMQRRAAGAEDRAKGVESQPGSVEAYLAELTDGGWPARSR